VPCLKQLDRLESGEVDQLVLTTRNNPRAVVVTVERFDELVRDQSRSEGRLAACPRLYFPAAPVPVPGG
jgi:hypothetical protein